MPGLQWCPGRRMGDAVSLLAEESFCPLGRARSSQDVSAAGALNCTSKLGLQRGFCKRRETGKYLSESINPPGHLNGHLCETAGGVSAGTEGSLVDLLNHFGRWADTKHCRARPMNSCTLLILSITRAGTGENPFLVWGEDQTCSQCCCCSLVTTSLVPGTPDGLQCSQSTLCVPPAAAGSALNTVSHLFQETHHHISMNLFCISINLSSSGF